MPPQDRRRTHKHACDSLFVKVNAVVVLATGVTATTGVLAVLADTAVAGADVTLHASIR